MPPVFYLLWNLKVTLKLNCNVCAASLSPDNSAIRRGIITCQYCSSILRITSKGTEAYKEELKHRPLPNSVFVKRENSGQITVKVLNYLSLNQSRHFFPKIVFLLILVLAFITLLQFTAQMPAYYRVPLLLLIVTGFAYAISGLRDKQREFIINENIVVPSVGFPKIPRSEIKQIYAIENQITLPDGKTMTDISLGVLAKDGSRTILINNIPDADTALHVEELVEVELGIFNLPVYGDFNLPKQENWTELKTTTDMESIDSFLCEYCGNNCVVTSKIRAQGFGTCEYCNGLTLVYKSDDKKPILGLFSDNFTDGQFRIEYKPNGLVLYPRLGNSPKPVMILGNGKLKATRFDGTLFTLDTSDINKLFVREVVNDPDENAPFTWADIPLKWHRFKNNWRRHYMEANTYSGELDEESGRQSPFELRQYQLMAHMNDGRDYWLISNIDNPQEAFFLSQTLQENLSS